MIHYTRHPLVEGLFEEIPRHELEDMAETLKPPGDLRQKLIIFEGKLLDGWNRQEACKMAGRKLDARDFEFFKGSRDEALALVMALNIHRRHLSSTTRRTALARILSARHPMAETGRPRKDEPPKKTVAKIAKESGVSESTVHRRLRAEKKGVNDTLLDPFGHEIPPDALPYWNRREEAILFVRAGRKLAQDIKKLNKDDPLWKSITSLQALEAKANAIAHDFEHSIPYCLCPTCMGKDPENCRFCQGRGLLTKHQYDTGYPKEAKKAFEAKPGEVLA
jgi:AraC-like DNA-binding protein